MHQIAARAGVGKATVSLALRDDPRLRPETRRRIQKIAEKMGYRPNAIVANLMAQLRVSRTPKRQATVGLLQLSSDPKTLTGVRVLHEWETGCAERAVQLGYGLEPFSFREPGIDPARLADILESRHIRGLVIAALPHRSALPEGFDLIWRRFACIAVGVRPAWPPLNFSSNDQFSTAFHAVLRLWKYGCRNIGLVLSPAVDAMADRRLSAGFWAAQESLNGCERIPVFPFDPAGEDAFHAWYAQHRPDAILSIHHEVKMWLEDLQIQIPGQVGLAHLDHHDALPGWAGMRQNNSLVGAAAIDMLIGQLHRNEIGLPEFPKASLTQSTWVDGATIARRTADMQDMPENIAA